MHGAQKNSKQKSTFFHGKGSESRKTEPGMEGGVFTSSSVFKRTEVTAIKFQVAITPERWGAPTPTRAEQSPGCSLPCWAVLRGSTLLNGGEVLAHEKPREQPTCTHQHLLTGLVAPCLLQQRSSPSKTAAFPIKLASLAEEPTGQSCRLALTLRDTGGHAGDVSGM